MSQDSLTYPISAALTSVPDARWREEPKACTQPGTPGKAAIVMATSGRAVTFGEYEAAGNRVAHLLRDAGMRLGDHIAVLIESRPAPHSHRQAGQAD